MRKCLESNKIFIELAVLIAALVFGSVQISDVATNLDNSTKIETYTFIEKLLDDSYPAIENFRNANASKEGMHLSVATELQTFLSQVYTCVSVGACDRKVSKAFICSSPKLSNPLSFSSGVARTALDIAELIPNSSPELEKVMRKHAPHLRVMDILTSIFETRKTTNSYKSVVELCKAIRSLE